MTTPTKTALTQRTAITVLAGLSLVGTLAACSSSAADGEPTATTPEPQSTSSATDSPTPGTASGTYKDGTYDATGTYQSPNGTETIGVELTLADDVVTEVTVTTHPTNPNTKRFQGEFADGIAAVIVGKNIDELKVDKVAGSSLTSGGFNDALSQIKAEAVG